MAKQAKPNHILGCPIDTKKNIIVRNRKIQAGTKKSFLGIGVLSVIVFFTSILEVDILVTEGCLATDSSATVLFELLFGVVLAFWGSLCLCGELCGVAEVALAVEVG